MSDSSRRKLLKSIAAGSGAIVAGKSLPDKWTRPVVDSVLLPAHAETSPEIPMGCDTLVIPATDQLCGEAVNLIRYFYVDDSGSCPILVSPEIRPNTANIIEIRQEVSGAILRLTGVVRFQIFFNERNCDVTEDPTTGGAGGTVDAIGSTRVFQVNYIPTRDAAGAHFSEMIITPV